MECPRCGSVDTESVNACNCNECGHDWLDLPHPAAPAWRTATCGECGWWAYWCRNSNVKEWSGARVDDPACPAFEARKGDKS